MIYFYHLATISFQSNSVPLIFLALLPQLVGICNIGLALYALGKHGEALDRILPALLLVVALLGGSSPPTFNDVNVVHHQILFLMPRRFLCPGFLGRIFPPLPLSFVSVILCRCPPPSAAAASRHRIQALPSTPPIVHLLHCPPLPS